MKKMIVAEIIDETALVFSITPERLLSAASPEQVFLARAIAMAVSKRVWQHNNIELGIFFNRDRTVVADAIRKVDLLTISDKKTRWIYQYLSARAYGVLVHSLYPIPEMVFAAEIESKINNRGTDVAAAYSDFENHQFGPGENLSLRRLLETVKQLRESITIHSKFHQKNSHKEHVQ